jgi:hypothetical protein
MKDTIVPRGASNNGTAAIPLTNNINGGYVTVNSPTFLGVENIIGNAW